MSEKRTNFLIHEALEVIKEPYENIDELSELFKRYPNVAVMLSECVKLTDDDAYDEWYELITKLMEHTPITTRALQQFMKTGEQEEDDGETRKFNDFADGMPEVPLRHHETSPNPHKEDEAVKETSEGEQPDEKQKLDEMEEELKENGHKNQEIEKMKELCKKHRIKNMSTKKIAKEMGIPVTTIKTDEMFGEIYDSGRHEEFIDKIRENYEDIPPKSPQDLKEEPEFVETELLTEAEAKRLKEESPENFEIVEDEETEKAVAVNGDLPEDTNYEEMLSQDLYKLCLERKIPVKPMQRKEVYINALRAYDTPKEEKSKYNFESPIDAYKACKEKNIKCEMRRPIEYYVELLEEYDAWNV